LDGWKCHWMRLMCKKYEAKEFSKITSSVNYDWKMGVTRVFVVYFTP